MGGPDPGEFKTHDPAEFVDRLKSVPPPFGAHPTRSAFAASVRIAPIEQMGVFVARVQHGDVVVDPRHDFYSINVPLAGGIARRVGLRFEALEPGSVSVGAPGGSLDLRFRVAAPLLVARLQVVPSRLAASVGSSLPCVSTAEHVLAHGASRRRLRSSGRCLGRHPAGERRRLRHHGTPQTPCRRTRSESSPWGSSSSAISSFVSSA